MPKPFLIYVKKCPVCGDGLCRVRICQHRGRLTGAILCDECETVWTDPSMKQKFTQGNEPATPCCPDCKNSLWEPNSHWADIPEVCLLGWYDAVHIVRPDGAQA
jgi:hypothetical protein